MPQNKATSRIAAITGKLVVAFAALLAPAILIAETTNVTFDAALTNETGWVYSEGVKITSDKKHVYFNSGEESIRSPLFPFVITNISLNISCSNNSPSRKLLINTAENAEIEVPNVCEANKSEWKSFNLESIACIRSFTLSTRGGSGNWHLYSATISGIPLVAPPTDAQATNISGTRFALSWTNPENAVSNRIEVLEIVETETSGGSILEYDFNDFTNNSGSATDITDDFTNAIPAFAGSSLIRLPANTNGIIQISKDTAKGYLVHSGFADYSSMSLAMSIRRPTSDHGKTFGIGYLSAEGTTNEFATFSLEVEFRTNTVSLASVPANASIILNTQGANSRRVVYIDYMAFIGDSLSTDLSTNLVKTAFVADSTTYSVRGLCPRTEYVARITAFDADGNESSPSEPLAVTTNGEAIPFSIRIR